MEPLTLLPGLRRRHMAAALVIAGCLISAVRPAIAADASAGGFVTVHVQAVSRVLHAYGQVEPIAVVQVRAVEAGTLQNLRVVPGSTVTAGEVLARIGGSQMQSQLIAQAQTLRSARAHADAANRLLQILRHQLALRLTTRQAVDAAQSDLVAARAAEKTASVQWQALRSAGVVRAPAAGTILAVQAADGESLASGETLMTLQPAGRLWVSATCYGGDAAQLHVGMTGKFQPAADGEAVPIRVVAIAPAMAADGGVQVGLVPTTAGTPQGWMNGQWGTVTLSEPARQMVSVPTQALILDRGHWWVLLHTPQGDKPQQVVPGPAQGWWTAIASGLRPGQQVVVTDAFLEYHRGIASDYTPPD